MSTSTTDRINLIDSIISLGFLDEPSKNGKQSKNSPSNGTNSIYQTNTNTVKSEKSNKRAKTPINTTLSSSKTQNTLNIQSMLEKQKERQILAQRKLEEKRTEQMAKEMSEMQPCVKMSKNSKEILKSKELRQTKEENDFNNLPVYLRTTKISEKNKMNLKNLIEKENEIMDMNNQKTQTKKFNQKDFDNFLKENQSYTERKNQRTALGTQLLEFSETTEQATFKPEINENSKKILENMYNLNYTNNERVARSKYFMKKEIRKAKEELTFKPNIGTKYHSKPLDKNYYQYKEVQENMKKNTIKANPDTFDPNNVNNTNNIINTNNISNNGSTNNQNNTLRDKYTYNTGSTIEEKPRDLIISENQKKLYSINSRANVPAQLPKNVVTYNPKYDAGNTAEIINDFL